MNVSTDQFQELKEVTNLLELNVEKKLFEQEQQFEASRRQTPDSRLTRRLEANEGAIKALEVTINSLENTMKAL